MTYEDFISRFPKTAKTSRGVMVQCPSHDDAAKTPSLSVGKSADGGVLLKCFAGCSNPNVVSALGLTMKDLFASEKARPFTFPARQTNGDGSQPPDVLPVIETVYPYHDELGNEVYQALRMKPKSFRQRRMAGGKWVWNMDGVVRVLYRLPQIMKAQQVVLTEGEKDVENLVKLGFEATCNVGGAGKWLDGYTQSLAGKDVVLCGDNDEAGQKHVELVFNSIAGAAKTVRILKLPSSVKDVSDFIAAFKTADEAKKALLDLISEAHPHIQGHNLPLYMFDDMEDDYRRFVRSLSENSFPLGRWVPSLYKVRPLVPGELVFIIGDTGTGKTGLLQNISRAASPLPTVMFELELPKEIMFERYASMITKLTGEEIETAYRTADDSVSDLLKMKMPNFCVCPVARLTVSKIEEIILRAELKLGEKPRVVLIDYIQLVKGEGQNRRERISDIAEELKVMAKSTRTIIIAASQIARPQNVDADWEPSLHSAKESGSIESSCGLLISAWQDAKESGVLNLRVLKSTKGGTGTFVRCNFDGARMIITERSPISPADAP